jgi:hypothetical protein
MTEDFQEAALLGKHNDGNRKVVDAPNVCLSEDEQAGDILLKFFRALGWNGEDILDPRKIRTTKEVYNNLYHLMCEKCHDTITVGMFMVNYGPGVDDYVPQDKVHLIDGWVMPRDQFS